MRMKKKDKRGMPSLTVDGKRKIIADAVDVLGKNQIELWLKEKNIASLHYFNEHVRKFGAKYFRELFDLSKNL
jgi:hypothetical protein